MTPLRTWLSSPHAGTAEGRLAHDDVVINRIAPLGPHVDGFEIELAVLPVIGRGQLEHYRSPVAEMDGGSVRDEPSPDVLPSGSHLTDAEFGRAAEGGAVMMGAGCR